MTGPSVIEGVTGEKTNSEDLGGSHTQTEKTGNAHLRYASEFECLEGLRKLLSYLPDNNLAASPVVTSTDDVNRAVAEIYDMIPEDPKLTYEIKKIVTAVVDTGSFMEIQPDYAKNIVTGLARIDGNSVGIVANNPKFLEGYLDVDASDKAARFVLFLDSFNIPILTFTDVPGYAIGVKQETMGIVRHGAKLIYAFTEASVPKINVIVGKAYGGAYIAMNSKHLGADVVYAFPTAQIAVMGTEGAADIIYAKDIAKSDDPITFRKDKIDEYRNRFASPYEAAKKGYVDDVIDPAFTRAYVAVALDMLKSKRETRPNKKHGNMPL
jgi:acetyl-CoA carboxylase carboxyltransferase component